MICGMLCLLMIGVWMSSWLLRNGCRKELDCYVYLTYFYRVIIKMMKRKLISCTPIFPEAACNLDARFDRFASPQPCTPPILCFSWTVLGESALISLWQFAPCCIPAKECPAPTTEEQDSPNSKGHLSCFMEVLWLDYYWQMDFHCMNQQLTMNVPWYLCIF